MQMYDLENEGQGQGGEKRDLHYSNGNVRYHIGIIATWQQTFT